MPNYSFKHAILLSAIPPNIAMLLETLVVISAEVLA